MMALKVWFLLLAVCVGYSLVTASPIGSETIIEDIKVVVNGEVVREQRESDSTCRHAKNTATLPDGSTSTSYEDFESGLALVQISNDTSVCLVREITQAEKDEAKTCREGTVRRRADQPNEEERELEEGPEVPLERLSPELRELCEGKRIVKLVPAGSDEAEATRVKRHCGLRLHIYVYYNCYTVYSFWLRWKVCVGPYYAYWLMFVCK